MNYNFASRESCAVSLNWLEEPDASAVMVSGHSAHLQELQGADFCTVFSVFCNLLLTGAVVLKMCYLSDSFRYELVCSWFVPCAFACTVQPKRKTGDQDL